MSKGKLISLESCDGGGKTTQIEKISNYLEFNNYSHTFFHFPMYGHNQFSDLIARFLRGEFGNIDEVDPLFVANMYAMDRYKFLNELKAYLKTNDVVLLDRYVFSNIAYQGAKVESRNKRNELMDWIFAFEFNFLKLPYPDLNLFLNVPSEVIKERLNEKREGDDRTYLNGKEDIHEADLDFQNRVAQCYLDTMSEKLNCKIVRTTDFSLVLKPEQIFNSYEAEIDEVLKK